MSVYMLLFFFQAEDGIRDGHVTGVQTCALPISPATWPAVVRSSANVLSALICFASARSRTGRSSCPRAIRAMAGPTEIGRASCRERGEIVGECGEVEKSRCARKGEMIILKNRRM